MSDTCYVYKWTHMPSLNWYVGSKTRKGSHPDDGYICSSKVIKQRILKDPREWSREVIGVGFAEDMLALETEILTLFDAAADSRSYNQHNNNVKFTRHGCKAWNKDRKIGPNAANKAWLTRRAKGKIIPWNKGLPMSEEQKNKISQTKRLQP